MLRVAVALCLGTYVASQLVSVMTALVAAVCYMGLLNYAMFWSVPFGATGRTNAAMLSMSRFTLLTLDLAVLGKVGSATMPTLSAVAAWLPAGLAALLPQGDEGGCLCRQYWALSLVSYVTAIYTVKLLYYKRAALMMQDPLVAGVAGGRMPPCSVGTVMSSLVAVFLACQYLVINLTDSECTGGGAGACCRDTFAPVNTWFAIAAIGLDLVVLVRFMSRWNAFLSMFAEETAGHLMSQFLLVSLVMLSCVWNALCHLTLVYTAGSPQLVDSFQGTPAFLLDVCFMATCVVLAFVDAQETMAANCELGALRDVHKRLKRFAFGLRMQSFGQSPTAVHDAYNRDDEEP